MRTSTYDKTPFVAVPGGDGGCRKGWGAIASELGTAVARRGTSGRAVVLCVECYPGVDEAAALAELKLRLKPTLALASADALLAPEKIETLVAPFLGGSDPVFGWLSGLTLPQFFDPEAVSRYRQTVEATGSGLVLIVGCGATLVAGRTPDVLVYADLARWEAQLRFRRKQSANLGARNVGAGAGPQYKRAFFVDWRVADRWKQPLIARWDYLLDTHVPGTPKLVGGEGVRRGLREAARRPFRVVPFFDPAPWGGQWMKDFCDLDRSAPNYGWCFDCVPEENSLLLGFGSDRIEIPSMDLVLDQPRALLGDAVHARFGTEFPIRFDFLDTMGGGNLSFQVHPLTEYIQQRFGMHYTQDESYYMLDAGPGASVFLGLREDARPEAMLAELALAQQGGPAFDPERHANRWPAKKHDHFLIPAGTVHCSGAEAMVLEISATPYIFTFKLWDWGRLGLDGKPRPIHLEHGAANIQWDRTTGWVKENLVNAVSPLGSGPGWREERTGLHEREFIETRRHWFTAPVPHHTRGGVQVMNLVEGEAAVVESPDRAFEPFLVHYAETFIVPAAVGSYVVRPLGTSSDEKPMMATMKAFVRT